ncbi:hypothetical protein V8C44DRAFT_361690 [Trichoderma aethiopicum]
MSKNSVLQHPAAGRGQREEGLLNAVQVLVDDLPVGHIVRHWHLSYEKFLLFAEGNLQNQRDGWTAIVDDESVSFNHAETYLRGRSAVYAVTLDHESNGLTRTPFSFQQS